MSSGVYGGDEVGGLVFDVGHNSFRVGYAGEDCPKAEIPSSVGILESDVSHGAERDTASISSDRVVVDETKDQRAPDSTAGREALNRKYFIDTNAINVPRPAMQMSTFLKDGTIENWDMFEAILDYAYKHQLMSEPEQHPVLMSEAPWNPKPKREKLCEVMFEKYKIPAFFLCKSAVLSAFANGRSTALVLDSGATHTSAIPPSLELAAAVGKPPKLLLHLHGHDVDDAFATGSRRLRTRQLSPNPSIRCPAIVRSPLGGDAITTWCKQLLDETNIEVVPPYMISNKEPVGEQQSAKWTKKSNLPEVTKLYQDYMIKEVIRDFQATVLQVCDTPFNAEHAEKWPALHYEFPNGYHQDFVAERLRIPEGLFDPQVLKNLPNPTQMLGVGSLVSTSINMCDVDIRSALYSNIVVTGGNTLLQGFVDRLTHDVQMRCPANMKVKVYSAVGSAERRFGPWIGGSILASLGSFQQMWISKQEYEESGKSIVEKKCP